MAATNVRVVGGGNTLVVVGSGEDAVKFISQLQDNPGRANANPVAIQGIGDKYPVEIATAYAQKEGTLTLTVWERWGVDGWTSLFEDSGIFDNYTSDMNSASKYPVDLVEVLDAQRKSNTDLKIRKIERGADGNTVRVKTYLNPVITDIDASESVRNEDMVKTVKITVMYTNIQVTSA